MNEADPQLEERAVLTVRVERARSAGQLPLHDVVRAALAAVPGVRAVQVERAPASASAPRGDVAPVGAVADARFSAGASSDLGGPTLPGILASGPSLRVPVFPWEIDPNDATRESGEAEIVMDGWEYRVWWQVHPAGLSYASIEARRVEGGVAADAPQPAAQRTVVNLVYDLDRDGVVAIYGRAGDFRPFVEAFRRGFGI